MNLKDKKLIVLIIVIIILLFITLGLYIYTNLDKPKEENKEFEKENTEVKEEITYPVIEDSAYEMFNKIYDSNVEIYANGYTVGPVTESIFGNINEKLSVLLNIEYKMTMTLYNFDISSLEKIKCSEISGQENWNGIKCGGASSNEAYKLKVQDLNSKYFEIFNEEIDYTTLDTSNLIIGTCYGSLPFKYIEEQSAFVSIDKNCAVKNQIEVTNITKTQDKDIVTLDVFYKVATINQSTGKRTYSNDKQDKFYFKVREDGTYYFYSSVAYLGTEAPVEEE